MAISSLVTSYELVVTDVYLNVCNIEKCRCTPTPFNTELSSKLDFCNGSNGTRRTRARATKQNTPHPAQHPVPPPHTSGSGVRSSLLYTSRLIAHTYIAAHSLMSPHHAPIISHGEIQRTPPHNARCAQVTHSRRPGGATCNGNRSVSESLAPGAPLTATSSPPSPTTTHPCTHTPTRTCG
eukprot:4589396-Prymnesium_polylepis.1